MRITIAKRFSLGIFLIFIGVIVNILYTSFVVYKNKKINEQITQIYQPTRMQLTQLSEMIRTSEMLIRSWVFIDRISNTPDKQALSKIIRSQFPVLNEQLQLLRLRWDINDTIGFAQWYPSISDDILKKLFAPYTSIMETLSTTEAYNDPLTMMQILPKVEYQGQLIVVADSLVGAIEAMNTKIA
ncbi:MAG: hypothetical protein ACP5PS_09285, partial [Bacteroidales bacterium]